MINSLRESLHIRGKDMDDSRRKFLVGAATLAGAGAFASSLDAQNPAPTDVDIVNFALRLENLEAAFYTQGLAKFAAADFAAADFFATLGPNVAANVLKNFQLIQQHEVIHQTTLMGVVKQLGGTPVPVDCYNFGFVTVDDFVMVAQLLENTGVMAYDGAIALLQSPDLRTAGATIATVEARHAAYLNSLNRSLPFPSSFDTPQSMQQILAAAGQFIVPCGGATSLMTKAVAGPKGGSTASKSFQLDASASTSANGKPLTYLWTLPLGAPYAVISNPTSPQTTVQFFAGNNKYTFQLQVTDSAGVVSTDTVTISYNGQ